MCVEWKQEILRTKWWFQLILTVNYSAWNSSWFVWLCSHCKQLKYSSRVSKGAMVTFYPNNNPKLQNIHWMFEIFAQSFAIRFELTGNFPSLLDASHDLHRWLELAELNHLHDNRANSVKDGYLTQTLKTSGSSANNVFPKYFSIINLQDQMNWLPKYHWFIFCWLTNQWIECERLQMLCLRIFLSCVFTSHF